HDGAFSSQAQRRAAVALACDASDIQHRISQLPLSGNKQHLRQRVQHLLRAALEDIALVGVNDSRLPLSLIHQQMYEVAAEAERNDGLGTLVTWTTTPWEFLDPLEVVQTDAPRPIST